MKKLSLTVVLCLIVALGFGQKKAVNDAKREIGNATSNIEEARNLIKGALTDPETKNNAETWFVAGKVEGKQFDMEVAKEYINKTPDEAVMYGALKNIKPFFVVADSLDMLPDEKGKVKPKFRKDMKAIMLANRLHYLNGGSYYFNNKNYTDAYDMFQQFFDIPNMKMFEGDNIAAKDTAYAQFRHYKGLALAQFSTDTAKIISVFEDLRNNNGNNEVDAYKILCSLYEQTKDTVNLVRVLKEGTQKFPDDHFFLLNLINQYIFSNQGDAAIEMLNKAIEAMPDKTELYNALGIVYENSKKDPETAQKYYEKALSIDPNYAESIGNLGRVYFNRALGALVIANDIKDNEQYKVAKTRALDIFKEALPFIEKAHQMKPEERDYLIALKNIYYYLNDSRYDEIDKLLNQ